MSRNTSIADDVMRLEGFLQAIDTGPSSLLVGTVIEAEQLLTQLRERFRKDRGEVEPFLERLRSCHDRLLKVKIANGARFVDTFIAVKKQIDDLEAQAEAVRAMLIDVAKNSGEDRLQAQSGTAMVRSSYARRLPTDVADRATLENLVLAAGVWREASVLTAARLSEVLRGDRLSQDLKGQINALCPEREAWAVRIVTR